LFDASMNAITSSVTAGSTAGVFFSNASTIFFSNSV
jgi:hypothetical protein